MYPPDGENRAGKPLGREDAYAVLAWTATCLAAVFIRGIRWDEHFELAEVVLGRVPYPEEHPLYFWTRYVRNLPIFLSSGIVWLFPGPEVICGLRNTLWMAATVLPAFLIGRILGGRALCGHLGAVLILAGIHQNFDANYPLYTWPSYFSNGHVGRGFALTTLCLLLSKNWRTAFALLGFLPGVHMGQAPLVYLFAGIAGVAAIRSGRKATFVRALPWAVPGLAVWSALWLYDGLTPAVATSGPFYSPADGNAIAQAYIGQHPHWAPPGTLVSFVNSNFILGAVLLVSLAAASREDDRSDRPWTLVALYFGAVAAVVWTTMLLHTTLGPRLPYGLLAWMPYRFTNHAASLFPGMAAAVLLSVPDPARQTSGAVLVAVVLVFELVKPALSFVLDANAYNRYFLQGDAAAFLLLGGAGAAVAVRLRVRKQASVWLALVCAGWAVFAVRHQYGAACVLVGAALFLSVDAAMRRRMTIARSETLWRLVTAAFAACLLAKVVVQEARNRAVLPRSEFEVAVTQFLASDDGALIVARPDQVGLHARIHHPVLADGATASAIVYTPQVASAIQKLHEDLYGVRFYPPPEAGQAPWDEVWARRSADEWRELGRRYSFRYVIAPNAVAVALEPVLRGEAETLYKISRKTESTE